VTPSLPPRVRVALYWSGYALGSLAALLTLVSGSIAAASPDVTLPVWVPIAAAAVGLVAAQLNGLAAQNVTPSTPLEVELVDPAGPNRPDVTL